MAYLDGLSEAELSRKSRIPIFKEIMGTDEVDIPTFVGALFEYHWNDHAGQLAKARKPVCCRRQVKASRAGRLVAACPGKLLGSANADEARSIQAIFSSFAIRPVRKSLVPASRRGLSAGGHGRPEAS
jgi:hypothetical protein